MEEEEGKKTKGTFGDSLSLGALDGLMGELSVHGQDLVELRTGREEGEDDRWTLPWYFFTPWTAVSLIWMELKGVELLCFLLLCFRTAEENKDLILLVLWGRKQSN